MQHVHSAMKGLAQHIDRQTDRQTNTLIHGSDHNNYIRAEFYKIYIIWDMVLYWVNNWNNEEG